MDCAVCSQTGSTHVGHSWGQSSRREREKGKSRHRDCRNRERETRIVANIGRGIGAVKGTVARQVVEQGAAKVTALQREAATTRGQAEGAQGLCAVLHMLSPHHVLLCDQQPFAT